MISRLDDCIQDLGSGEVVRLDSGESIFKLDGFTGNPVVKPRNLGLTWRENGELKEGAVFNGGAEVFQDRVILLPRCHWGYRPGTFVDPRTGREGVCLEDYVSEVWPLVSEDGIHFTRFGNSAIRGDGTEHQDFTYGIEDIRIVKSGDRYLLVGCGRIEPAFKGVDGDRIAVYSTEDFLTITCHGMVATFDSRNGVPFPEPVNDRFPMLLRFYPDIHLDFLEAGLDQLLNPSRHVKSWRRVYERREQSLLLSAGRYPHEAEKIGPGPPVIRTDRGWLLVYHAVGEIGDAVCRVYGLKETIERGYSVCAALLDLENPRRVVCRTRHPIYIPSAPYELYGDDAYRVDIPAVVFPVGAVVRRGKLVIYAGSGDKYVVVLSCRLDGLVDYLLEHCRCG